MNAASRHRWLFFVSLVALSACGTETPTEAIAVNAYARTGTITDEVTVYRAWYSTTLFRDAVAPGGESDTQRTVPGSAAAYAVLVIGWDPSSTEKPSVFIPLESNAELKVNRGETLRISISDRTFTGRCPSKPLDQKDADFITERIFPAEFAGARYDASTCTARPRLASDGGTDATPPGVLDAAPAVGDAALPTTDGHAP